MGVRLEYEFGQGSKEEKRKGEPSVIMEYKNEN